MRRTLLLVQYTAFAVAIVSFFVLLFALGDREDKGAVFGSTVGTIVLVSLGALGSLIGAMIQWVGVPPPPEKKDDE